MNELTIENLLVLLILTFGILVIVFGLVYLLQKIYKMFFFNILSRPPLKQSNYQIFDFKDSFYNHEGTNETFPSNYQTINIYSAHPNNQPAPSINISLKSLHRLNNKPLDLDNSLEGCDEKMERLINFANNFCRSSYNLKWKNKFLKKIGSRREKLSFLITYKKKDEISPAIFSFLPVNFCKLKLDEVVIKNGVKNLCENIQHPNIQNLVKIDFEDNLKMCIVVKPLENCSVKDLIYSNKDCKLSYQKKYEVKNIGKPLELSIIANVGRQILLALHYMHSMGFYHNNLQSSNVYVRNNRVVVGEIENYILNLPLKSRKLYEKILINEKIFDKDRFDSPSEIIDIIQFGNVLYEMVTGCELKMLKPDPNDYIFIPRPVAAILKEIFPENDDSNDKAKFSLNLKNILNDSSNTNDFSYFTDGKTKRKSILSFPKIRIEELLYDEFFRDESDPFYQKYKDLPRFQDQITKGIIKQLNKLNYSNNS